MPEHISVNVEAAIAKRLFDGGHVEEARKAIAKAKTIETGTDPASLEPETRRPLTADELAEIEESPE